MTQMRSEEHQMSSKFPVELYEVIRVIRKVPLLLEEHLNRLYQSARLAEVYHLPGPVALEEKLTSFLRNSEVTEGNIRLSLTVHSEEDVPEPTLAFIPHRYPGDKEYNEGVRLRTLMAQRELPNAKIYRPVLRQRTDEIIAEGKYYEVLLVNHEGYITEGSRSNVFFIKGNRLYTPPTQQVLPGITRKVILRLCIENDILISEEPIKLLELDTFDAVFISGTSVKVLAVSHIDDHHFDNGNMLVKRIGRLYDEQIESYIRNKIMP
ncbi:aminotransferase class IV [Prolixibacter denitrificans]|uniref:branched-chain-amino-acid transaminase n=1 Tax=Prolixibacter denitrificans TaxID=1541063 RepID=A0A2P8CG45_9BACT|nr:aminotransferase class IV [Prolixibacter denitrificans]PSK83955.1 branched-chain amino acid aminotransferase [Prolixibacter denitrificans]GET23496.1 branched-chain amino acid aminotransferase [Prolixibacter denitrificans]